MNEDQKNYIVSLFDTAFDSLEDTLRPYLSEIESGKVIFCQKVEHEHRFTTLTIRPDQIAPEIGTTLQIQIPSEFIKFVTFADERDHYLVGCAPKSR